MAAKDTSGPDHSQLGADKPAQSLSRKLLVLTVLFVMLAEVLIFVPSVANTRLRWLDDRLNTAAAAAVVAEGVESMELPSGLQRDTLMATGTKAIVLRKDGSRQLIAADEMPPAIFKTYDLSKTSALGAIWDAFETLVNGGDRYIRVVGNVGDSDMIIDLVLSDGQLRQGMLDYARNVLALSLLISFITAGLVFFSLNRMMIVPIRRMTKNMQAFSESPEDPARVITPHQADDELGQATRHLASMQTDLQKTLKQQKNLADLGLAVSKINHDMRNILASAQLMSDRLAMVDDPMVKRFAPKLLRTIDRAVGYTTGVLAYGRAQEAEPNRRFVKLETLARDVCDLVPNDPHEDIELVVDIDPELEVEADSEQLFRVIHNLVKNAAEALLASSNDDAAVIKRITISAEREGGVVQILVDDTGPGMPPKAKENLFAAFLGSTRAGGTGLGLAIARELIIAHGGSIELMDKAKSGTCFKITLPDQPVALDKFRAQA